MNTFVTAMGKIARWLPSVVRLRGCVRKVIAVGPRGGQHNLTHLLESVAFIRLRFLGRLTKNAPRQILSWDLHLPVTGRCRSNLRFGLGYPARSLSQPWSATLLVASCGGQPWPTTAYAKTCCWLLVRVKMLGDRAPPNALSRDKRFININALQNSPHPLFRFLA